MAARKTIPVTESQSLLDLLAGALPGYKKTTLRNMLKHGAVAVNGQAVERANHALEPGDEVVVSFEERSARHSLSDPRLKIIYEDEAIVVINKPPGLLSVATLRKGEDTAYALLNEYLKTKHPPERAYIVHRIDRETSGLLLFGKSDEVKHAIKNDWRNTEKLYLAVTEGVPRKPEDTIVSHLLEHADLSVSSVRPSPESELAITHYRVVRSSAKRALLEVKIETGRKNQIRVHLAEMGTPVVGDSKYGAQTNPAKRLALHAWKLELNHPLTGERAKFEVPFPAQLESLVP